MVELLEKWGNLPEGSTELLKSNTLKDATREHMQKFAEELADEIATAHALKETNLDLDKLRWPVTVHILDQTRKRIAYHRTAVIDRMGRLFFRYQDAQSSWFTPGFYIQKVENEVIESLELILESTTLFSGDQAVAIQVTTEKQA